MYTETLIQSENYVVFGETEMSGKNMLEGRTGPVTQSLDAIKSLLAYVGRASDPMPSDVRLDNGRMVLVLSNKMDAYYTCTSRACSCPGNQFRHNCKHMRTYFPETTKPAATASESIRPVAGWIGPDGQRANGPVEA